MEKPVVNARNESSIKAVLALNAVRFYHIKIVTSDFSETGKYRFHRKLAVAVNHSDISSSASVESAAHIPSHPPVLWLSQHANIRQSLSKLLADVRRLVHRAYPRICNEDQFPVKSKQRRYLVKILHEWDDFFYRAMRQYRNGKLDGRFN